MLKIYLKEDPDFQQMNLIENMKYYDMPKDMIERAEKLLTDRREKLKRDKAMLIYLIDDDEDQDSDMKVLSSITEEL